MTEETQKKLQQLLDNPPAAADLAVISGAQEALALAAYGKLGVGVARTAQGEPRVVIAGLGGEPLMLTHEEAEKLAQSLLKRALAKLLAESSSTRMFDPGEGAMGMAIPVTSEFAKSNHMCWAIAVKLSSAVVHADECTEGNCSVKAALAELAQIDPGRMPKLEPRPVKPIAEQLAEIDEEWERFCQLPLPERVN